MNKFKRFLFSQRGAVPIAGIMLLTVGMIFMGIGAYFIPVMIGGFEEARMSHGETTELDSVTTDNTVSTVGSITLSYPLWRDSVSRGVISISSNSSGDSPVADNYTTSTKALNLTGLTDNGTRTLTTNYYYTAVSYYTGLAPIIKLGPTIIVLGFLVSGAIVGFLGIKIIRG